MHSQQAVKCNMMSKMINAEKRIWQRKRLARDCSARVQGHSGRTGPRPRQKDPLGYIPSTGYMKSARDFGDNFDLWKQESGPAGLVMSSVIWGSQASSLCFDSSRERKHHCTPYKMIWRPRWESKVSNTGTKTQETLRKCLFPSALPGLLGDGMADIQASVHPQRNAIYMYSVSQNVSKHLLCAKYTQESSVDTASIVSALVQLVTGV